MLHLATVTKSYFELKIETRTIYGPWLYQNHTSLSKAQHLNMWLFVNYIKNCQLLINSNDHCSRRKE